MNIIERRQFVRDQVIDTMIAKTAINKSRRERAEASRKLRKTMMLSRAATAPRETVSYSAN